MKYRFTKHFEETLKARYGINLTNQVKCKFISNIDESIEYRNLGKSIEYSKGLKDRYPKRLVYIGDILHGHILVAYDSKTRTFISALAIRGK